MVISRVTMYLLIIDFCIYFLRKYIEYYKLNIASKTYSVKLKLEIILKIYNYINKEKIFLSI